MSYMLGKSHGMGTCGKGNWGGESTCGPRRSSSSCLQGSQVEGRDVFRRCTWSVSLFHFELSPPRDKPDPGKSDHTRRCCSSMPPSLTSWARTCRAPRGFFLWISVPFSRSWESQRTTPHPSFLFLFFLGGCCCAL